MSWGTEASLFLVLQLESQMLGREGLGHVAPKMSRASVSARHLDV